MNIFHQKKKKKVDHFNFFIIEYQTYEKLQMNENDIVHMFEGESSLGYDILLYKPTKSIIILVKCYFLMFKFVHVKKQYC